MTPLSPLERRLTERLGLAPRAAWRRQLPSALAELGGRLRLSPAELERRLLTDPAGLDGLASHLVVSESYFFRHPEQLAQLVAHVRERRTAAPTDRVAVWSAGCARGEEIYSVGLALAAAFGVAAPQWVTHTTDPTLPFRALQVGAVEATGKLPPRDDRTYPERASQLARLAKAVARTPILHRRRSPQRPEGPVPTRATQASPDPPAPRAPRTELVLIGGSTGGPPVVAQLLRAIPVPSPVPILVAQHIASGFAASFAAWLADTTGHRVVVHGDHSPLRSGVVHVAADDHHLELTSRHLLAAIPGREGACCPSIDLLFGSAAVHRGPGATALLLSGMGRDGAAGLAQLHRAGAQLVVQEPASCVVDSIPTSALATGAAAMVLDPSRAAAWLARREWPDAPRIEPTSSRAASPARPRRQ